MKRIFALFLLAAAMVAGPFGVSAAAAQDFPELTGYMG